MKIFAFILLITFCMALLFGCNTVRGLGQDIESLGSIMQKKSNKSENKD